MNFLSLLLVAGGFQASVKLVVVIGPSLRKVIGHVLIGELVAERFAEAADKDSLPALRGTTTRFPLGRTRGDCCGAPPTLLFFFFITLASLERQRYLNYS